MKAGDYKATQRGYIFNALVEEDEIVTISSEFAKKNPKFKASWLEPVKVPTKETKVEKPVIEE